MEILKFIFRDGVTFIGFIILISCIFNGLANIISCLNSKSEVKNDKKD